MSDAKLDVANYAAWSACNDASIKLLELRSQIEQRIQSGRLDPDQVNVATSYIFAIRAAIQVVLDQPKEANDLLPPYLQ